MARESVLRQPLAFVDLETTGGGPRSSRVLEIGVVRVEAGRVVGEFRSVIDPQEPVPGFITQLTGLTDDDENLNSIADFVAGLGNVERIEVLPFHQLGRFKWHKLGLDYTLDETPPPAPEQVARACETFRAVGLTAY